MQRFCLAALLSTAACTGTIGPPSTPATGGPETGSAGGPGGGGNAQDGAGANAGDPGVANPSLPTPAEIAAADPNAVGMAPLRRLSLTEYRNTVRDLFGIAAPAVDGFPPDRREATGFPTPDVVGGSEARAFEDAAEKIAATAMAKLTALLPCTTANDVCARQFIQTFGRRAFRRPLDPSEIADLQALYTRARTDAELQLPFNDAIRLVITAMLQSPNFLYRRELGPQAPLREGDLIRLNTHETASQLAYFLWSTMPDQVLFDAADAGKLGTTAEVTAQVRRMLADARTRATVETFHDNWLDLAALDAVQKDGKQFPEWNADLRQAMVAETRAFASSVILDGDGRFDTLLTGTYSFVNDSLARLYGVGGVTGTQLQRRDLNPDQRSGLLTQASVLALKATSVDSDPIRRGKMVRVSLLCQGLPPPPNDVPPLPARDPNASRRQQFTQHEAGTCKACHELMDPIGFGLENYDSIGRYRTTEAVGGFPIDGSGEILGLTPGQDATFKGARELGSLLAKSEAAGRCFVTQWLRFGLGRGEVSEDLYALNSAYAALASSGDIREMLVALTTSKAFLYRAPVKGEVLQ